MSDNLKTKADLHADICIMLNDIYQRKQIDYGDSFGETFRKLGEISAITRITDKVNRLQTLCKQKAQVKDESVCDTLFDLANYAIMTIIEIKLSNEMEKSQ